MELTLDCRSGMDELHTQLAESLDFPCWYGRNLDALHDCLTDLTEDLTITLIEPFRLPGLLHVLEDCAEENLHIQLIL